MPLVIYFKRPEISLIVKGDLNERRKKAIAQAFGKALEFDSIEGNHKILIPVNDDTNITYISTMTDEEFEDLKKQREAQRAAKKARMPIIERPQMIIPTTKKKH